jgi:hypothetical protein
MKTVFLATLLLSSMAFAETETISFEGTGLEGKPCKVTIEKEDKTFKKVEFSGPAKVWEIMSENGGSYGPATHIASQGGFDITEQLSWVLDSMKAKGGLLTSGEVYEVSLKDAKKVEKLPIPGMNMIITMKLTRDAEKNVTAVNAQTKMKIFLAPVATGAFVCTKN